MHSKISNPYFSNASEITDKEAKTFANNNGGNEDFNFSMEVFIAQTLCFKISLI
jgi:hypothetical protein